jgi:hypothetical protein
MSAALVGYVWFVNDDFPIVDDWQLVPVYTGTVPVTPSWLWAQYNEHRMPLPLALLVLGGSATGHDYRTGMLLNALTLSALAALMIFTARRMRGGLRLTDALFPAVLLHWGQSQTLLIGLALNLVCSTALAGVMLLIIVRVQGALTLRQGIGFGVCLLALPLCGSSGAVLVPALALWLAVAAAARWRSGAVYGRRDGGVMMGLALASIVLLIVYFRSLAATPSSQMRPMTLQVARTALKFLTDSIGPFAEKSWPGSGAALAALALVTLGKLLRDWRIRSAERLGTEGLLSFGGAMLCLALAIGWGRGAGFETRYVTLAAPILCFAYFVWRGASPRIIAPALSLMMVLLLPYNTYRGITRAEARRARMHDLQSDIDRGLTPAEMAKKWTDDIYAAGGEAILAERFEMLRRAGQGPYKGRPQP